jgi:hypothetical protein
VIPRRSAIDLCEWPERDRRWILWGWVWVSKSIKAMKTNKGIKSLKIKAIENEIIFRADAKGFGSP